MTKQNQLVTGKIPQCPRFLYPNAPCLSQIKFSLEILALNDATGFRTFWQTIWLFFVFTVTSNSSLLSRGPGESLKVCPCQEFLKGIQKRILKFGWFLFNFQTFFLTKVLFIELRSWIIKKTKFNRLENNYFIKEYFMILLKASNENWSSINCAKASCLRPKISPLGVSNNEITSFFYMNENALLKCFIE